MWSCSLNGERNPAFLISVGDGKYQVVLVSTVLVSISLVVRGQYWLSVKAVNVGSGVSCASERLSGCVGVELFF